MNFVLASSSPRRKKILSKLNIDFEIFHPNALEPAYNCKTSPVNYAKKLSRIKAASVYGKYNSKTIIGADTIVVLGEKVLGKPKNKKDAYNTLMMLSGKTHQVITAVTIMNNNNKHTFSETTLVTFFDLNEIDVLKYVDTDSPYDKAGSYGMQSDSAIFVKKINGCYYNVIGFPLSKFHYTCKNTLNIPI